MKVLVAGAGNVLKGDDGFGVVVAQHLLASGVPAGVQVADIGIGGIHLVQQLLGGVDALVVVDAVDMGRQPGTVLVIRPEVRDVGALPAQQRQDLLADMHYATPERAFMLARALGVLPGPTWVVGCQPLDTEHLGEGLSARILPAVPVAAAEVRQLVTRLGIHWE